MTGDADERTQGQDTALKRRGLIAAAAALVAGLVAKQMAEPVLAAPITGDSTSAATPGVTGTNSATGGTGVSGDADAAGVSGSAHGANSRGVNGSSNGGDGIGVNGFANGGNGIGVQGTAASGLGIGVQGMIPNSSTFPSTIAVKGFNQSSGTGGIGVQGQCDVASGIGVVGASVAGVGVKGAATTGLPIVGQVVGPTSINAGVLGVGTNGPGVQGQSNGGPGLVGTTFATDGVQPALIGSVQPGSNAIALRGSVQAGAVGYAGIFDGDVLINGALRVFGSPKNAAVKHPGDGTYRLLYCEESPESWFADYGEGTLAGDKADIKLDPDFAVLVHADAYHVFLTAHGPQHLHVAQRSATGFTVVATALGGAAGGPKAATGGGTFSWRVVAKRKDITGERLAKVAPPPPMKPVTPFTVPETPEPKPPATKP